MFNLKFISQKKHILILALLAIFFFFIYSYLSFSSPEKFNSPDEAANYFFTKRFVETSSFTYQEPLNEQADNLIHPRNTKVVDSKIVPYSFLGLYLIAGIIGKVLGLKVILYVVPLFSAISGIFFYLFLKEIFSKKTAFLSSFLLLIHPAFWYFSSQAMHHNALFAALLIITLYFLIKILKGASIFYYLAFGFFASLTCVVRTSEIIWLGILTLVLLAASRKNINLKNLAIGFVVFILVLIPLFCYNVQLYGHPLTIGYLAGEKKDASLSQQKDALVDLLQKIKKVLLPSGINLAKLKETIAKYIFKMFYPFTIFLFLGIFSFLRLKKISIYKKAYFCSFVSVALYLILYYGSGAYFGAKEAEITVGSSLIRYWLPIYILGMPFVSIVFWKIVKSQERRKLKILVKGMLILLFVLFSFNLVYFEKDVGLLKAKENSRLYAEIENEVVSLTEKNSVIITSYADKFLFPKRKVIGMHKSLEENALENNWSTLKNLMDKIPFYYFTMYGINIDETNRKLREKGLKLIPLQTILDIGSLYKFEKIGNQTDNVS